MNNEVENKANEIKESIKKQELEVAIDGLLIRKIISNDEANKMKTSSTNWSFEQLEMLKRLSDLIDDHNNLLRKTQQLVRDDLETSVAPSEDFKSVTGLIENQVANQEWLKKIKSGAKFSNRVSQISYDMLAKGMIKKDDILDQQTRMFGWSEDAISSMEKYVNQTQALEVAKKIDSASSVIDSDIATTVEEPKKRDEIAPVIAIRNGNGKGPNNQQIVDDQIKPRAWGPGSEIADLHHKKQLPFYCEASVDHIMEKLKVGNKQPELRNDFKLEHEDQCDNKSTSSPLIVNNNEELYIIKELRIARELLDKFDNTFADAKVAMFSAKEKLLNKESAYNGTTIHNDHAELHELTVSHAKAQRHFVIIEKIYNQALKAFLQTDVEQVPDAEIKQALADYNSMELNELLGGQYVRSQGFRKDLKPYKLY